MTHVVTDSMARALIKKHREFWPGGGWPTLEDARALIVSALASCPAAPAPDAADLIERLRALIAECGGIKAAPSDRMFYQMIADYEAAIERSRAALAANPAEPKREG